MAALTLALDVHVYVLAYLVQFYVSLKAEWEPAGRHQTDDPRMSDKAIILVLAPA